MDHNCLRAARYGYVILSVLLGTLGVALMCLRNFSGPILFWITGILMILFGIVKILGYLSKDLYRLAFQYDLAFGILLIVLGLILLLHRDARIQLLCLLLGFVVLTDALLKIQISLDARVFGIERWWLILCAAIFTGVIGFVLLLRLGILPGSVRILSGIAFLSEGLLNLVTVRTAVRVLRDRPEILNGIDWD